jgi:hypothetical protein
METCARCGKSVPWWSRDLALSGLCPRCARQNAREDKEALESMPAMSPAADEALKERLEKLQAQGALSKEEAAHLKGALHEKKASSRKVFWLRITLVIVALSAILKGYKLMTQPSRGTRVVSETVGQPSQGGQKARPSRGKMWRKITSGQPLQGQDNVSKGQPGLK